MFAYVAATLLTGAMAQEPNPPQWPTSVSVFRPGDSNIQKVVDAAFAINGGTSPDENGQFSDKRFAFLFTPGQYNVEVPVGYYTTVHGLGEQPSDVVFTSAKGVYCEEGSYSPSPGALDTFWRGAENFKTTANYQWFDGDEGAGMLWAVSQAAGLRRIEVQNDLVLFQYVPPYPIAGLSSGGYLANSLVHGAVHGGSQQQWFTRDSTVGNWTDGVWNMVFSGVTGAPPAHCGAVPDSGTYPYVVIEKTAFSADKPFVTADASGSFSLQIPVVRNDAVGHDHGSPSLTAVGFEKVYVADADTDTAASINDKLSAGLHVVLSPGIYQLKESLLMSKSGQVLLGLGMATLVSAKGNAVVTVPSGLDDVRIGGLLLQAGPVNGTALLVWGSPSDHYAGTAAAPGFLHDIAGRVGGPDRTEVMIHTMIAIHSGNVVLDNLWLWRADHTVRGLVLNSENPCATGLHVTGDDVTAYSLAVEHTLNDMVLWEGNGGKTYFYQSEYPYDVTQANFGDPGFAAYRVADGVSSHEGHGVGVYHFFRDNDVTVATGIKCPPGLESSFHASLGVYLNGTGLMQHILNDKGDPTGPEMAGQATPKWLCA